jgi:hypothetical protein
MKRPFVATVTAALILWTPAVAEAATMTNHKPRHTAHHHLAARNTYGSYNPGASPQMGWDNNRPHGSRLQDEFLPNQPDYILSNGGT